MKTIGEVIKLSAEFLTEKKIDPARRTAEEILSHVLRLKKMDLYLQFDKPIVEKELTLIREILKKCGKGEPFEYAVGEMTFFHCHLKTDRRALIPRPETELLVEMVSKRVKKGILWDICTGSGCIGIALKKAHPELSVSLSDLSPHALALAAENAKDTQVEILQGDLLEPFKGRKADYLICNPPYVSQKEYDALDPSVRDFEPKQALLAGPSGMEFYERLARVLPDHLNPGGQVFFEIGSNQGEAMKRLFPQGELHFDLAGHPRFFFLA